MCLRQRETPEKRYYNITYTFLEFISARMYRVRYEIRRVHFISHAHLPESESNVFPEPSTRNHARYSLYSSNQFCTPGCTYRGNGEGQLHFLLFYFHLQAATNQISGYGNSVGLIRARPIRRVDGGERLTA